MNLATLEIVWFILSILVSLTPLAVMTILAFSTASSFLDVVEEPRFKERLTKRKFQKSPLAYGEVFDPEEEVKKILKVSRLERNFKLKEFKIKFAYQKAGLAEMQIYLMSIIREKPDTAFEDFCKIIDGFAIRFGMTKEQRGVAKLIFQKYTERRREMKKIREEYSDDAKLYESVFGKIPFGRVKIAMSPFIFSFCCEDEKDFAFIRSNAFVEKRDLTDQDMRGMDRIAGVFTGESLIPELKGTITAEKRSDSENWIFNHEEQHAINSLCREAAWDSIYGRLLKHCQAFRFLGKEFLFGQKLCIIRQQAEEHAGNEILAYSRINTSPSSILWKLNHSGSYDYFENLRKLKLLDEQGKEPNAINQFLADMLNIIALRFLTSEYRKIVKLGIRAFKTLKKAEYSLDERIAILGHEPLARWPKVTRRIKEIE